MTVHVNTGKIKGTAGLRFFSSKDSGEAVTVSRQTKQKYELTEALATHFVKVILDAHFNNTLTEDFVEQLKKQSSNKTIGKKKQINLSLCNKCDYVAKNEHGLNIHKGKQHTDANEHIFQEPKNLEQKLSQSDDQEEFPSTFSNFICHTCGLRCKDERFFKYHSSLRHDKFHPGEPTKIYECENCPKELTNDIELEAHMKHHKIWRENIIKTPSPKYECDHCDYKSIMKKLIDAHMINKHGEIENMKPTASTKILKTKEPVPTISSQYPKSPLENKKHLKECFSEDDMSNYCDICNKLVLNERELRIHKTTKHITDKDANIGVKRDESFMTKTNSLSPIRKRRNIESVEFTNNFCENIQTNSKQEVTQTGELNKSNTDSNNIYEPKPGYQDLEKSDKKDSQNMEINNTNKESNTTEEPKSGSQNLTKSDKGECYTKDPSVKDLPEVIKKIVKEGSKEVNITGNGSCLIGTTAVHIAGDEDSTNEVANDLSMHMSMYRSTYLDKISADFPLTVKIGTRGATRTFEKGEEGSYFDWLIESTESVYMWRGCVDILGLCNLYKMDIDVIVYMEGTMPEVKHFSPDTSFPWLDSDTMKPDNPNIRKYPKMTVLNYKDVHFNLVVDKDSMVAKSRTFGFQREKAGCLASQDESLSPMEIKIKSLENALADSKAENKVLIDKLSEKLIKHTSNKTEQIESKCSECDILFENNMVRQSHMDAIHYTFSFNCPQCGKGFSKKKNLYDHQFQLKKHMDLAHQIPLKEDKFKCISCAQIFVTKPSLIRHRLDAHGKS